MFQDSWTFDYLFIEWKEKPLCLVCGKNVSALKLFDRWCAFHKDNDAVALLKKHLLELKFEQDIFTVHCFIHEDALFAKTPKMTHAMEVLVKCVNEIGAKGLKHPQIQSFLEEVNAQHTDLIYHSEVRWLSCGKVLKRCLALVEETKKFLQENPKLLIGNGQRALMLLLNDAWLLDLSLFSLYNQ